MLHLEICSMHRHREWILKTEEPAERGESALKEVKWHYKDNPIRLWKMFLTKSETQWSVMGVLWLIKAFPWNNQSLSFSLIFPLSLNHALSLFYSLTHIWRDLDATSRTWISGCDHQPTVAACESTLLLFMNFNGQPARDLVLKLSGNATFIHYSNSVRIEQFNLWVLGCKLHLSLLCNKPHCSLLTKQPLTCWNFLFWYLCFL